MVVEIPLHKLTVILIPIQATVQTVLGIGRMEIQTLTQGRLGEVHQEVIQGHHQAEVHRVVAEVRLAVVEVHVDRDNINKTLTRKTPQKYTSGGFFTFLV